MFTIIGADGKEYGPVTADKLREWIVGGRANAQTQCRRDGEAAWSTLSSLPEFAASFANTPPPMGAGAPTHGATRETAQNVDPQAYADAILASGAKLQIGAAISRGIDLLKTDYWAFVGVTFVMTLIVAVANFVPLGGLLLTGLFVGGLEFYYVRKLRGESPTLSDCFEGFNRMTGALILGSLVATLLTLVGCLFLILPGIYLAVAYTFTYLLILDHKLDFWPAMEVSRRVITANWFWMFLLIIAAAILSALGFVVLLIGYILTAPIFYAAIAASYEQLIGAPKR